MKAEILDDLSKKVILNCLHRTKVTSGNDILYIPCGKCVNCQLAKNAMYVNDIRKHATNYKYSFFGTLTYSNEYVPRLFYNIDHSDTFNDKGVIKHRVEFFPKVRDLSSIRDSRLIKSGDIRRDVPNENEYVDTYINLSELMRFKNRQETKGDYLYYAPYRDFQNFIKRLQNEYKKAKKIVQAFCSKYPSHRDKFNFDISDLSISYYAVSEYGSKRQRPHFHFILFTNSEFVAKYIVRRVHKAWSYGITHTELSINKCATYVSSYLQCVNDLRSLYDVVPPLKPSRHTSIGFGKILIPTSTSIASFKKISHTFVNGTYMSIDGRNILCYPRRSDFNRLFPRPRQDVFTNYSAYQSLVRALWSFTKRETTGIQLVNYLVDDLNYIPDVVRRKISYWLDCLLNILANQDISSPLPTLGEMKFDYCDDIIIQYLKLWPLLTSTAVRLHYMSRHDNDYDDIFECTSYNLIYNRLYSFISTYRKCCLFWQIKNYNGFCDLMSRLFNFHNDNSFDKLDKMYRKLEEINDDVYSAYYYNFLISQTTKHYDKRREKTITSREDKEIYFSNILADKVFKDAKIKVQELQDYKKHKHKLSCQTKLFNNG